MRFLFLFVLLFAAPADARIIEGDWETAGLELPPEEVSYPYEYDCQLEITDNKFSRQARMVGVAKVTVKPGSTIVDDFSKLEWLWVRQSLDDQEEIVKGYKPPYSLRGNRFSLLVQQAYVKGRDDIVVLGLTAAIHSTTLIFPQTTVAVGSRSDTVLRGQVSVRAYSARGPKRGEEEVRSLFGRCKKVQ